MRFSLLQFKSQTVASWSLVLVAIVLVVCFSQNLGYSAACPTTPQADVTEQLTADNNVSECSSSEQLIQTHAMHLEFAIPLFILALVILVAMLKQQATIYFFTEPITSYGVRRHLAFCTFQE
ncbi:hypothetical protein [Psychromonas hadalis]|uniref:hypothetical protein n=1 Tax=Psychromonas hadalis TaxID=211669 RepID=UPI000A06CAE0|nr:hypothetical protein [Psychromonas hadalis]